MVEPFARQAKLPEYRSSSDERLDLDICNVVSYSKNCSLASK